MIFFQIHKKRRIVGRVRCKNIKTECPKVNCADPVLLPGRCCKICPGETDSKLHSFTDSIGPSINDVKQNLEDISPPSPFVTQKYLFYLLYHKWQPPFTYLLDVIYECPLPSFEQAMLLLKNAAKSVIFVPNICWKIIINKSWCQVSYKNNST